MLASWGVSSKRSSKHDNPWVFVTAGFTLDLVDWITVDLIGWITVSACIIFYMFICFPSGPIILKFMMNISKPYVLGPGNPRISLP